MRRLLSISVLAIFFAISASAQDTFSDMVGYYAFKLSVPHVEELNGKMYVYQEGEENCAEIRCKDHRFPIRGWKLGDDGKYHAIAKLFRFTFPITIESDDFYGAKLMVTYQKKSYPVQLVHGCRCGGFGEGFCPAI